MDTQRERERERERGGEGGKNHSSFLTSKLIRLNPMVVLLRGLKIKIKNHINHILCIS